MGEQGRLTLLAVAARVVKIFRQAICRLQAWSFSIRECEEANPDLRVEVISRDDLEFGYMFIADELQVQGMNDSEQRVWRLCSKVGIFSLTTR